jgi:hydrogenase-4 component F
MSAVTPVSAAMFVAGMFAVTACPPFGPFFSELRVLRAGFDTGHGAAGAIFLVSLLFAFFGLTRLVFAIVNGRPRVASAAGAGATGERRVRETLGVILPPMVLLALSLWLGLATPGVLREAWTGAAGQLSPAP